jgi:hypothetical protein
VVVGDEIWGNLGTPDMLVLLLEFDGFSFCIILSVWVTNMFVELSTGWSSSSGKCVL